MSPVHWDSLGRGAPVRSPRMSLWMAPCLPSVPVKQDPRHALGYTGTQDRDLPSAPPQTCLWPSLRNVPPVCGHRTQDTGHLRGRAQGAQPGFALTQLSATLLCHGVRSKSQRLPRKRGWGRGGGGPGKGGLRMPRPLTPARSSQGAGEHAATVWKARNQEKVTAAIFPGS